MQLVLLLILSLLAGGGLCEGDLLSGQESTTARVSGGQSQFGDSERSQSGESEKSQGGVSEKNQSGVSEKSQLGVSEKSQSGESEKSQSGVTEISQSIETAESQSSSTWDQQLNLVRPKKEIENEPNPFRFAFMAIEYLRESYGNWCAYKSTVRPPGEPPLAQGNLKFEQDSKYCKEAAGIAQALLTSSFDKGLGIGLVEDDIPGESKRYWVKFARIEHEVASTLKEETASEAEEQKQCYKSALTDINQEVFQCYVANFETEAKSTPPFDPCLEFSVEKHQFMVMRRSTTYADFQMMVDSKHEGLGVGTAVGETSSMVVFLFYQKNEDSGATVRKMAADLVASELATLFVENTIATNLSSYTASFLGTLFKPSWEYYLGKRYVAAFIWSKETETPKPLTTKTTIVLPPQKAKVLSAGEPITWQDQPFLRNVIFQSDMNLFNGHEFGTGFAVSNSKRHFRVQVSFPTERLEFPETMRGVSNRRKELRYEGLENNFMKAYSLDLLAAKIANESSGIERPKGDCSKEPFHLVEFGETYTAFIRIIPAQSANKQSSETNTENKHYIPGNIIKSLTFVPSLPSNEKLKYVSSMNYQDAANGFLDTHILGAKVDGFGVASMKRRFGNYVDVILFEAQNLKLTNEGIFRKASNNLNSDAKAPVPKTGKAGSSAKEPISNNVVKKGTRDATALNFIARYLQVAYVLKLDRVSQWNAIAKKLAVDLLRQSALFKGSGIGCDTQTGTDFEATFISVTYSQIPPPDKRKYADYEAGLKQSALEVAVKIICRDGKIPKNSIIEETGDLEISVPSPTPIFFNPYFEYKSKEFVIMRQGIYSLDLDSMAKIQDDDFGVAVEKQEKSQQAGQRECFMVVLVRKRTRPVSDDKIEANMASLSGLGLTEENEDVGSYLQTYCKYLLAEEFLKNYVNEFKIADIPEIGKEGFGVGNGFSIVFGQVQLQRMENEPELERTNLAIVNFVAQTIDDKPTASNMDFSQVQLDFQWKTKYPVRTFLPVSSRLRPWASLQLKSCYSHEIGMAATPLDSSGIIYGVAMVIAPDNSFLPDFTTKINKMRLQKSKSHFHPIPTRNIDATLLHLMAHQVAEVIQSSTEMSIPNDVAFGEGFELTSIFLRHALLGSDTKAKENPATFGMEKLLSCSLVDSEHLPNILDFKEPKAINSNFMIPYLPTWKEGSVWDVLQLIDEEVQGVGYWSEVQDDTLYMAIVFKTPSPFANTTVYQTVQKIHEGYSLEKVFPKSVATAKLCSAAQEVCKQLGFSKSVIEEGHGYGGHFKATFKIFTDLEDAEVYLESNIPGIITKFFETSVDRIDILHSSFDFVWSSSFREAPRRFTLVSKKAPSQHIAEALNSDNIGFVVKAYDTRVIVVLVTQMTRPNLFVESIYNGINVFRVAKRQILFRRSSSLGAVLDKVANRICQRLATEMQLQGEGTGVGKNFIAFYKRIPKDAGTAEMELEQFLRDIVDHSSTTHNLLESVDDGKLQFEWCNSKRDMLADLVPKWKGRTNSDYALLSSGTAIDMGISLCETENKSTGKAQYILVATAYFEMPHSDVDDLFELIQKHHQKGHMTPKVIKPETYILSTACGVASDLAQELLTQSTTRKLHNGFGVGIGFTAAFKLYFSPTTLTYDIALLAMKEFLYPNMGIFNKQYDYRNPPIANEFNVNSSQDELAKHFIFISKGRSSRDFLQLIISKHMGLGMALDHNRKCVMLVVLCPWQNVHSDVDLVVGAINKVRQIPLPSRNTSLAYTLDYLAYETAVNFKGLTGHFTENGHLKTVWYNRAKNQHLAPNGQARNEAQRNDSNISNLTNPSNSAVALKSFLQSAMDHLLSNKIELTRNKDAQKGHLNHVEGSNLISGLDYSLIMSAKQIGIYAETEVLVLYYTEKA